MPTLYVENVPKDVYDALRSKARQHRKSIAAEVMAILEDYIVTPAELNARKRFLRDAGQLRAKRAATRGPFPSAEEMVRADRSR